ncbi:MAG: hypothetical protein AAF661_00035 [Pseudomonadota bacterium]
MVRVFIALAAIAALAGCAQKAAAPAETQAAVSPSSSTLTPAPIYQARDLSVPGPGYRIGLAFPEVTPSDLLAASQSALQLCVIGKENPLGGTEIARTPDGYRLVAPVSRVNVYAIRVQQNPLDPTAQDVEVAWEDSVPQGVSIDLLKQIQAIMERRAPC